MLGTLGHSAREAGATAGHGVLERARTVARTYSPWDAPAKRNNKRLAFTIRLVSWNIPFTHQLAMNASKTSPNCRTGSGAVVVRHSRYARYDQILNRMTYNPQPTNPVSVSSDKKTLCCTNDL